MSTLINFIDTTNASATARLKQETRHDLGQFFTPAFVAEFMANLFSFTGEYWTLLEPSAGAGALITAFLSNRKISGNGYVEFYEVDTSLADVLLNNIQIWKSLSAERCSGIQFEAHFTDFVSVAYKSICMGGNRYTHVILNPPYAKINTLSNVKNILKNIGQDHVNLYTAFIGLSMELLVEGGQLVALVPRSFCNGTYYKSFRKLIKTKYSIDHIHLFEQRGDVFGKDSVLQENIIIKLSKRKQVDIVNVSFSKNGFFQEFKEVQVGYSSVVQPDDIEGFIHIPHSKNTEFIYQNDSDNNSLIPFSQLGISISTGPVVDYRCKDYTSFQCIEGKSYAPLLYPNNFRNGELSWPLQSKKPSFIQISNETSSFIWRTGYFVVVKRFSSKEEKRRIVASVVDPPALASDYVAFENHLNVFHINKSGLDRDLAYGLAYFLNLESTDNNFRSFSGHTQVNAGDLKNMKYPPVDFLRNFGKLSIKNDIYE